MINSKRGAGALEAGSIVNDLREQFHQHREMVIREKLKEMDDVTPQERDRIARITEELIELAAAGTVNCSTAPWNAWAPGRAGSDTPFVRARGRQVTPLRIGTRGQRAGVVAGQSFPPGAAENLLPGWTPKLW